MYLICRLRPAFKGVSSCQYMLIFPYATLAFHTQEASRPAKERRDPYHVITYANSMVGTLEVGVLVSKEHWPPCYK